MAKDWQVYLDELTLNDIVQLGSGKLSLLEFLPILRRMVDEETYQQFMNTSTVGFQEAIDNLKLAVERAVEEWTQMQEANTILSEVADLVEKRFMGTE
jgi:YesN/AraC family two-component response regulator